MSLPPITTVVGSGTMGPGIASIFARAGSQVRIFDISEAALENAKKAVELCEGVLDQIGGAKAAGGSISFHTDLAEALASTNFVIEAVAGLPRVAHSAHDVLLGVELANDTAGLGG